MDNHELLERLLAKTDAKTLEIHTRLAANAFAAGAYDAYVEGREQFGNGCLALLPIDKPGAVAYLPIPEDGHLPQALTKANELADKDQNLYTFLVLYPRPAKSVVMVVQPAFTAIQGIPSWQVMTVMMERIDLEDVWEAIRPDDEPPPPPELPTTDWYLDI